MTKFDESIISYRTFMADKLGDKKINNALLTQIAQELGPAIYDADASLVACSDHTVDEHLLKQITYELGTAIHHLDAALIASSDESELSTC